MSLSTLKDCTPPNWDLSDLYQGSDDGSLQDDLKRVKADITSFVADYKDKVVELSSEGMYKAITRFESIRDVSDKLATFAYLQYVIKMNEEKNVQFFQNISEILTELCTALVFFTLQINQISDQRLSKLLESPVLQRYRSWFEHLRLFQKYQLSESEEAILQNVSGTATAWQRLFDETMASLKFTVAGHKMHMAEVLHKLSDSDPRIRKSATQALCKILKENVRLFALVTNTLAKSKNVEDKLRGFAQPISSRNLSNFVEDDVVDTLIDTVKSAYSKLSHRYYGMKAKWLGTKQLNYYDRLAPLPNDDGKEYAWSEAVETVLEAYGSFSKKFADYGKLFFDNNWIDAPVTPGKDSGAFAHPACSSMHPYLMVNFLGKGRDVMTLAHELGHGIHQFLAKEQGPLMCNTPLILAEVASIFGEQLTFAHILKEEDNTQRKRFLIASKVEDLLNTIVRQIAFCDFEMRLHKERQMGEVGVERICDIWMTTQQESLGPLVKFDHGVRYLWAYIPHFIHSPFYVYSYAFANCLVNSLYQTYLDGCEGFEAKYLDMLKAGGTLTYKEVLKPFGLNPADKGFWNKGLSMISTLLDQLE
ncbi:M3 family oligoendopeptidase [Rickettsiales endosymbiont of Peranema trichophorum]|uniref:M3 family oligoendopeptidase n=1 Tax=Rickettsiales endosymbiont of Peranema trichophorum TaxID=2486577 RepID=UPI001022CFCE|nr:M3 family oligoendopeptidase [Rickettsiales endosymbiont of Peranema trichophorum]RZI47486.1 M3 family oligoendopeptidase [Rickettsiales endosymbiont of Peranema trichophorum]